MELRRRNFLGLIGAAAAAPLMPVAAPAGYSHKAYGLAVSHAQRFPTISVGGMSARLRIPRSEAQALMQRLSQQGLVGALDPTRPGTMRATSNIARPYVASAVRRSKPRGHQRNRPARDVHKTHVQSVTAPVADPMLAHLYDLCQSRGFVLSAGCFV